MNCCSECFSSQYIKGIINSNKTVGNCSFCSSKKVFVYSPKKLTEIFRNVFDLYEVNSKSGKPIEIQIENDFEGKIFSSKIGKKRKALLREIIAKDFLLYKNLFKEKITLKHTAKKTNNSVAKPLQISWEKFAHEIKSTNRFHIQNTLDLSKLSVLLKRYERSISKGKIYYRARISEKASGHIKAEMKNPPADKAKAGRANPLGISYLYLANDIKTTLFEARASLYDYVTIGDFKLKESVKVINLRGDMYDPMLLADDGQLEDFLIHLPFITKLEEELSKPRRRSDNELDYLPTQYLSEFIKSMGFDGVEFQSSLSPKGYNLAIFNPIKFDCVKVNTYEIKELDLKHKIVD